MSPRESKRSRDGRRGSPPPRGGGRGSAGRGAPSRGAGGRAQPATGPRPQAPRGIGGEQVEGRQAVREMLLAGTRKVREIWLASDLDQSDIIDDIIELADDQRVPITEVARKRLEAEARTDAPQGVLAKAAPLPEYDLDDLATKRRDGRPPFLLALDGITDPGNLGALLRSAEGAGVTGVVLPKHRSAHITPTVAKTAAGAVEYLPMALVGGLPAALNDLKRHGLWVVALDGDEETSLFDMADLGDQGVVLVLGAEGAGISRLVRQRADVVVSIPMLGRLTSLNVSNAGALACYEIARRR
ncbi:MAG: 23S rRNA (guanosine(2251)-2'-O)-methyltransferase RlmB [Acidimicrobiia bacterium]